MEGDGYFNASTNIDYLSHVPAYMVSVGFPSTPETPEFQERALVELQRLQHEWAHEDETTNPSGMRLDFFCQYAYLLEYERALNSDLPLVPVIFLVMLGFTMFVFHKYGQYHHDIANQNSLGTSKHHQSRFTLGIASVVTIGCSLMSGFGLMFCWGVPFTNITLVGYKT
jgi:hypothetical protein